MPDGQKFFATCPRGVEDLLHRELLALGGEKVRAVRSGVAFEGGQAVALAACLWSRVAGRVLLPLLKFPVRSPEDLYEGIRGFSWEDHLDPSGTLAVDAGVAASTLTHSRYAALKAKDAVVDRFRDLTGKRPTVRTSRPDARINIHVHRDIATVSLDLSGESLHLRGYRKEKGAAPLRENLAAAILFRAGWPEAAAGGSPFVDPMCGSGTLPIEAALMAGDIAPGLRRAHFGFLGWKRLERGVWRNLLVDARFRAREGMERLPVISGYDRDEETLRIAVGNSKRAGLGGKIKFKRKDIRSSFSLREPGAPGVLVINPPYGHRMGDEKDLRSLYGALGKALKSGFPGWSASIFTGQPEMGKETGLRAHRKHVLFNGPIRCELLHFEIRETSAEKL
jgi:23S rRNA (guanine2445-N2)-methyltransferase / 23S rRNA (guanine2069-N7)-methyltransferase